MGNVCCGEQAEVPKRVKKRNRKTRGDAPKASSSRQPHARRTEKGDSSPEVRYDEHPNAIHSEMPAETQAPAPAMTGLVPDGSSGRAQSIPSNNPLLADMPAMCDSSSHTERKVGESSTFSSDDCSEDRRFSTSSSIFNFGSQRERDKGSMARARKRLRQWLKELPRDSEPFKETEIAEGVQMTPEYFDALSELERMVEGVDYVFEVLESSR